MKRKITVALLLGLLLSGCTDQGAWDLFRILEDDDSPPDILDSLYARYTFDSSVSPGTDDSGNALHGTLNGATWVRDATRGGVIELNGTSDYVALPSLVGGTPKFTISAWINLASLGTVDGILSPDAFNPRGVRFFISAGQTLTTQIEGNVPTTTGTAFAFGAGDIGQWFHVAAVCDGVALTMKLYVDGQIEAMDNLTTAQDARLGSGRIGGRTGPPDSWFHGRIDDVRFYSRTLSDTEIDQVYLVSK